MPGGRGCTASVVAHGSQAALESFSTLEDDGDLPYGSGCGGVVYILLERRATADPWMKELDAAFHARTALAAATILEGPENGVPQFRRAGERAV